MTHTASALEADNWRERHFPSIETQSHVLASHATEACCGGPRLARTGGNATFQTERHDDTLAASCKPSRKVHTFWLNASPTATFQRHTGETEIPGSGFGVF